MDGGHPFQAQNSMGSAIDKMMMQSMMILIRIGESPHTAAAHNAMATWALMGGPGVLLARTESADIL